MPSAGSTIVRPVILCGGAGTRLWPVSRREIPKQFVRLVGDQSLLQQTLERLRGSKFAPSIIVSGEEQSTLLDQQLKDSSAVIEAIVLEPAPRNTAAAAALAAAWLNSTGRDELLLLMPSDHVIGDPDAFLNAIEIGVTDAASGSIVTFGAEPTDPNTQYGYIEATLDADSGGGSYRIARFHEKPDSKQAADYLSKGGFLWNCGIFLVKASTLLEEMQLRLPSSSAAIVDALAHGTTDGRFVRPSAEAFSRTQNISFDNGIMEKTDRGVVVPVQMKWSDVGAWDAVWKLGQKDQNGNVIQGEVLTFDSQNSLVRADGSAKIVAIGCKNLCIIAVDGGILVAPMDRVAEIKFALAKDSVRDR